MSLALQPLPKLPATADAAATETLPAYSESVPSGFAALLDLLAPPSIEGEAAPLAAQATAKDLPAAPLAPGAGLPPAEALLLQGAPLREAMLPAGVGAHPNEAAAVPPGPPLLGNRPLPSAPTLPAPEVPAAPAAGLAPTTPLALPAAAASDGAAVPSADSNARSRGAADDLAPAQPLAAPPLTPVLARAEPALQQAAQHIAPPITPAAPQKTTARTNDSPRVAALEAAGPSANAAPRADSAIAAALGVVEQDAAATQVPREPGSAPVEMLATPRVSDNASAVGQRATQSDTAPPQPALPSRVTWLAEQGGGTARLQLHPRELGDVEVSVRVRGRNVEVRFVADDPAAQFAVAGARERLVEALGARDLKMESFQVRGGDDGGPQRDAQNSQSDARNQREAFDRERGARGPHSAPWQTEVITAGAGPVRPLRSVAPSSVDLRV